MVHTDLNRIQFGNGDVSIMVSMAGTREEPQAMLVFQNREPTTIGGIDKNADLSKTVKGVYHNGRVDLIQIAGRLIGDNELRPLDHRAADSNSLFFAA